MVEVDFTYVYGIIGGNHFRAWKQYGNLVKTGAWFLGCVISMTKVCERSYRTDALFLLFCVNSVSVEKVCIVSYSFKDIYGPSYAIDRIHAITTK